MSGCAFHAQYRAQTGSTLPRKAGSQSFTRESIDHGVFIVIALELPNQVVVDALVHGG